MKTKKEPHSTQWERKHSAILEAARKIFFKHGFEIVSMDEIAKAAKVSKRTVYDHFQNKEKLFEAILVKHWNQIFSKEQTLFGFSTSITLELKNFATQFLNFLYQEETIDLFRILISESRRFPHLIDPLLVDEKAPFTRELINFLNIKIKNEQLKVKDVHRAASHFMGLLKEYHFWPMMLGFTKFKTLKNKNVFIDEVVDVFLKWALI